MGELELNNNAKYHLLHDVANYITNLNFCIDLSELSMDSVQILKYINLYVHESKNQCIEQIILKLLQNLEDLSQDMNNQSNFVHLELQKLISLINIYDYILFQKDFSFSWFKNIMNIFNLSICEQIKGNILLQRSLLSIIILKPQFEYKILKKNYILVSGITLYTYNHHQNMHAMLNLQLIREELEKKLLFQCTRRESNPQPSG